MDEIGNGNSSSHVKDVDDSKYKSLLIVNESKDAWITLYLFPLWFPFCKVSTNSKIILPKRKYLHRQKKGFKFTLVAIIDKNKVVLLGPVKLVQDKLIKITESPLRCNEDNLDNHPQEKQICLRKMHFKTELTCTSGMVNLYDVLGLDMEDIRKLKMDDQKQAINKAFRERMKIWHPDKNFGDDEIAKQIAVARDILLDDERRACYHNETYYDKGWFSPKRYKAIFWPDCYTEKQNIEYRCRMAAMVQSLAWFTSGAIITALTAGAAAPAALICGAIFGGGYSGAGMLSGMYTVSKKAVTEQFDEDTWALKAITGFVGGAISGVAAAGITAGVVGIGSAALESSAVTIGQYAGIGAASGSVGGAVTSLAADIQRALDGEEVTWTECFVHAITGAAIGAATGALGGLATKGIANRIKAKAFAAPEGERLEQGGILNELEHVCCPEPQRVGQKLTEGGARTMLRTTVQVVEERLDDSVENKHVVEHVGNGVKDVGKAIGSTMVYSAGTSACYAANNYIFNDEPPAQQISCNSSKKSGSLQPITETDELSEEINQTNDATSNAREAGEVHSETAVGTSKSDGTDESYETGESHERDKSDERDESHETDESHERDESHETDKFFSTKRFDIDGPNESDHTSYAVRQIVRRETNEFEAAEEPLHTKGTFRYNSEGAWLSKMIVKYYWNGQENKQEAKGSGNTVKIPLDARQVEVRFQVRRPFWGDIMKYDRFDKTWCRQAEPRRYEPHVFRYEKPPLERTFTISGNLWWEAVMRVSDEYHEETREM